MKKCDSVTLQNKISTLWYVFVFIKEETIIKATSSFILLKVPRFSALLIVNKAKRREKPPIFSCVFSKPECWCHCQRAEIKGRYTGYGERVKGMEAVSPNAICHLQGITLSVFCKEHLSWESNLWFGFFCRPWPLGECSPAPGTQVKHSTAGAVLEEAWLIAGHRHSLQLRSGCASPGRGHRCIALYFVHFLQRLQDVCLLLCALCAWEGAAVGFCTFIMPFIPGVLVEHIDQCLLKSHDYSCCQRWSKFSVSDSLVAHQSLMTAAYVAASQATGCSVHLLLLQDPSPDCQCWDPCAFSSRGIVLRNLRTIRL